MKLTRKKFTVTGKKFTGNLLGSLAALLLLLILGACTAAGEELYFEPQEAVLVDVGSAESLNFYLDQMPSGLSGYNLTLSISDPSVARITGVECPSWASLNSNSGLPADFVWIKAVDLTENVNAGDSNVLLGTVIVESLAPGETNLTVSVNRLDDDSENTIPASIREAKLTVGNLGNPIISVLPAEATLSSGTSQVFEIRADKFPKGLAGYDLNLTLENPTIGKFTDLEFPSWAAISENSSLPATSVNLRAVDNTGIQPGDENVLLANVTFLAETPGGSEISLTFKRLDDDSGDQINALSKASILKVQDSLIPPVAAFTATPTSGIAPLTVNFTDQSTGSPTEWFWDFGDGTNATEQNVSHTYASPGIYTVNFTVTNAGGSDSEVKTDYITVSESSTPTEPKPVAAFTADVTSGPAPLSVQFTDLSENATKWDWDFGDGNTSTEHNPMNIYSATGEHTVTLSVSNAAGTDTETKASYIKVGASPTDLVADFSGSPTSGKAPLTVTFTDKSTDSPTSWAWDFDNDGTIDSTEQNPTYTYTAAGNYTVNLTVTNAGGSDEEIKNDYITVGSSSGGQNSSSGVSLNVTIVPVICFEVSPSALDFGELSPGQISEPQSLTLKNCGISNINVTAEVSDASAGDELFSLGLLLDSKFWNDYWKVIGSNSQESTAVSLHVPSDYTGAGNKKGTITFWAEAA